MTRMRTTDNEKSEARGKAAMDDREQESGRKKQKTGKSREEDEKTFQEFVKTLKSRVSEDEVRAILSENGQEFDSAASIYEHCADQMMYGLLESCPSCGGPLKFAVHEYVCAGYISEWSKCSFSTKDVPRKSQPLKIPKNLKNEFVEQWEKEHDTEKRPVRDTQEPSAEGKPFSGMQIVLAGRTRRPQYKLRDDFEKSGGKVVHVLKEGVSCLVVAESNLSSGVQAKIGDARSRGIPVVKETWLQDCLTKQERLDFQPYELAGSKQAEVKPPKATPRKEPQAEAEEDEVETTSLLMDEIKLAGKRSVHKDSELEKEGGKVLEHDGIIYNCAFSMCDQTSGLNHVATHQLVQLPDGSIYLYHKRGRLPSGVPLHERLDEQSSLSKAVNQFAALFEELTGNEFEPWERQKKFTKKRSKFYPLDMAEACDARAGGLRDQQLGVVAVHSKLDPKVSKVCKTLFSQAVYRYAMFEMGIDSPEIPTGTLTDVHIKRCEECLLEFAEFLKKQGVDTRKHEQMCLDFSNRWFSLLPSTHPTVINDIGHLTELGASVLESVRDISVASHIIEDLTGDTSEDPLSDRYAKLKCALTPVDKESDDYRMVQNYLDKTYEPVKYDDVSVGITMEELFTVESSAGPSLEEINKLNNKVLLWCGTRTCNLVRYLSKGMVPAIFQAPVPGYMFGRGLYCTDASCKAANYAFTGVDRPEGFLMLAIVGLGDKTLELSKPTEDVHKYEREKVSIKGLGKKAPDSSEYFNWKHNVTVPCGTLKPSGRDDSLLDYNEYVVYDPKQVRLQFIAQVRYEEMTT